MDMTIGEEKMIYRDINHNFGRCHFISQVFQTEDVILELNRILKIWRFENYQTRKNCRLKDYERFGRWATSPERDADGLDYIFYDGPDNIIAFWDSKTRVLFAK
jgi:hypothetical protein